MFIFWLNKSSEQEVNATYKFFIPLKTNNFDHYKLSSDHLKNCNAQLHV